MAERTLLGTITGEYFQPVRLHYRVFDREALLEAFRKLRCLEHDRTQERWVWLYDYEAKTLQFKKPYAQIPKHLRPIVLGSFFLRAEEKLVLDLRSCERATAAITFFDKHLPRAVTKVTQAEVVNKLFPVESANIRLENLFDQSGAVCRDPEAELQRTKKLVAHVQDPHERFRIALEDSQRRSGQPLPEIERFPVHYYEEGIDQFATSLKIRQIVAQQHWLGTSDYSLFDVIQLMVRSM